MVRSSLSAKSWLGQSIAIGLAASMIALLISLAPITHHFDNQYGLGILYAWRGPNPSPPDAIVFAVDRKTLNWLREIGAKPSTDSGQLLACLPTSARGELTKIRGPGSLPRSVYACLLKQLIVLGYPVVVFDIVFSLKGNGEDDAIFAEAIKDHGTVVMLVGIERSTVNDATSERLKERRVLPIAPLAENSAARGAFIVTRTGGPVYGYWRKFPGFEDTSSLPDEAYRLFTGKTINETDEAVFEYFWLYGPPGSIQTVSVADILRGNIPEAIRSKASTTASFVGASDPNMANFPDTFPSFFHGASGSNISGVELAATGFLNLQADKRLRSLSAAAEASLIVLFAFVMGFVARARSGYAMVVTPSAAILYLVAAKFAFSDARIFLPIATPVFVVAPTAFVLAVVVKYRFARALLMHLAPAPVAKRMLSRATDNRAEIVSGEATVVFFDLIGSTAIAEKITPVNFSMLLNNYHETVTDSVTDHRGQVSAFSGDGVMAVFTKSDAGADHAIHACRAAVSVIRGMRSLDKSSRDSRPPHLSLRVGINSGDVAEGEIGALDRFNFSVVGDVVNLASRLEQLGKTLFPAERDVILVGGATHRLANGRGLSFTNCGFQQIRGRECSEDVYRLMIN